MAAGYGAPAAPYTGFPDWQAGGAPGGPLGPGGQDKFVNGGDYAYVIREDDPAASSSRSRPTWGRLGEWSPGNAAPGQDNGQVPGGTPSSGAPAGSPSVRGRAITVGAAPEPASDYSATSTPAASAAATAAPVVANPHAETAPAAVGPSALSTAATADEARASAAIPPGGPAPAEVASSAVDPDLAYGPDDPGYGPPSPDWYRRTEEAPVESVEPEQEAEAEGSPARRGPFEPARHDELAHAGQPAEDADGAAATPDVDLSEMPEFDSIGAETPDLLDLGPDDPVDGALGGLRNLYQTAEAIASDRLERNLDRLVERQRMLITEYFTKPGDLGPSDPDAPPVSIGFDSAGSLAGLRGELRTSR
jgi:hypothetical protein